MLLRCTARLLDLLRLAPGALVDVPASDDDWYANLLWLDRRKCVLLTHAGTLFPVLAVDVRKRDLQPLGPFVIELVHAALTDEGLPPDALGDLRSEELRVAKTASRAVLGFMVDSAFQCEYAVDAAGGLDRVDVVGLNRRMRRNLHNRGGRYDDALTLVKQRAVSAGESARSVHGSARLA